MKKKSRVKTIFLLLTLVLAVFFLGYHYIAAPAPVITGYETFKKLPRKKHIIFTVRNDRPVDHVSVSIVQGLRHVALLDEKDVGVNRIFDFILEPRRLMVADGKATVVINATSGLFSRTEMRIDSVVDTVPPVIKQVVSTPFVKQGSTGAVKARVIGATNVYVKVGKDEFPMTDACNDKEDVYCTLFPVPLTISPGTILSVSANDGNDNYSTLALDTAIVRRKFRRSSVDLSDGFIENRIVPMLGESGTGLSVTAAFRKVNEEWRRKDNGVIEDTGRHSEGSPLWKGRFLQLRGSRVFARFGDKRDYYYHGEKISSSRHLGYDLASVGHAPVTAANNGIVVYVGDRLIYGNTVIIDHGLGLMSLYGHMSHTSVKAGERVTKGEIIGRTGNTGLAMGDHLHFGLYVHGVAVNPLDWWDANWISIKIMRVLLS